MQKLRLSDADRTRFGCEEWLESPDSLSTQDAEAVEAEGGDPWLFWSLAKPKPPTAALRLMVWLALRKAGVTVPLAECHFDLSDFQVNREPGKAPSARSGSRTRPASAATSTPRSRRKA